jgi:hypothetical protein
MAAEDDKHGESADALEAMANGQDAPPQPTQWHAMPPQPPTPQETDDAERAEGDDGEVLDAEVVAVGDDAQHPADPAADLAAVAGATPPSSPATRKARAEVFHRKARRAHAHQFKKFMIPLLLISGAALFVLGTVAAFLVFGSADGPAADREGRLVSVETERLLVLAAFPVGAILLLGAWLFHLDLRRAKRQ